MATTTNFGWETPDDTDLVKDGALAMRTLGNAIDASLVDLKGGTTGQVLSKNSNTDMDFTWVTSDDANAIQNAIVDAKGDLIAASAADTPARLAVGNNGETLVADSSTSTGLRYNPLNVMVNPVVNGGMDIWQRGTSFAISNTQAYTADRWQGRTTAVVTSNFSRQTTSDTTNLPNIQYALRAQRASGQTATPLMIVEQSFETVNSIPYAGKTVTLSFYARAGANFSAASNALTVQLRQGTGTDQNIAAGYTGSGAVVNQTATLTTTWQRFAYSGTVATNSTEIGLQFYYQTVGTASTDDWFEITGVQIDVGTYTASSAPTFRRSGGTLAGELAAASRYYQRISNDGGNAYSFLTNYGMATTTGKVRVNYPFKVPMRIAPTALDYSTLAITNDDGNVYSVSSATLDNTTTSNIASIAANTGSTITQYRPYFIGANNSASAYIGFSAEL